MRAPSSVTMLIGLTLLGCSAPAASPTSAPAKPAEATKPAASPAAASPSPSPAGVASPGAAASPPASPAAGGASPSPSPAAVAVTGEVDSVEGRIVSIATNTGLRRVEVPEATPVQQEGRGGPADLQPGGLVGVTGRPDGTAVVVRILPQGITPKPEQFPMGGPQAGNVMTNARIDSFDGRILTLDLGGQNMPITVPPEAEIVKPLPATFADIQAGKRVAAFGTPAGDLLRAQTITVLTQPPVIRQ